MTLTRIAMGSPGRSKPGIAERKAREILAGGLPRPAGSATTVKVRNGKVLVSDGPFAETKEQITGFGVPACTDLHEAIEVAARHPTALTGTFELRPHADQLPRAYQVPWETGESPA
jgi:hypothetical protein